MGQPTTLQNVDEKGYVFVTEAADCQIVTSDLNAGLALLPLPATPLAARRRMYIRNNASEVIYVGGSDVTTANGYPIPVDEELVLDITDDIIVYVISGMAVQNVRVLELS